jgi:multidrug resistance efflux pump
MRAAQKRLVPILLLTGIAILAGASCRSASENAPAELVVVSATKAGTVKRVLVNENADVTENTVLIEIAILSNNTISNANANRQQPETPARNTRMEIASAEEDLQRASVELQRLEPLVASGSAPQSHLDAARAQYQQAQERLDRLRRNAQIAPSNPALPPASQTAGQNPAASENNFAVRAPVAGNVRVISVRAGQTVKAGQPIVTISTAR